MFDKRSRARLRSGDGHRCRTAVGRRAHGAARARTEVRQRRAQADGPGARAAVGDPGAPHGPARGADPAGLLLRHGRPGAPRRRRRRPRPAHAAQGRRLDGEAPAGRPERPAGRAARRRERSTSRSTPCPAGTSARGRSRARRARASILGHVHGGTPVRKIFSKEQRAFYAEHAPEGVALDDLHVLGPIFVLKLKWEPESFERRIVAEVWLYPDGSRILELSTQCATTEAFEVAAETRAFLTEQRRRARRRAADEDQGRAELLLKQLREAPTGDESSGKSRDRGSRTLAAWSAICSSGSHPTAAISRGAGRAIPTRSSCPRRCCSRRRSTAWSLAYHSWLERWPNVESLAAAPPADVIREWQGLGDNRRAVSSTAPR